MYIYIYVHAYVFMYVNIYTYMYTHIHSLNMLQLNRGLLHYTVHGGELELLIDIRIYARTHMHIYVDMFIHTRINVRAYVYAKAGLDTPPATSRNRPRIPWGMPVLEFEAPEAGVPPINRRGQV